MKKNKDEKLSVFIALRLTIEEGKEIKKEARAKKLSLSAATRERLFPKAQVA